MVRSSNSTLAGRAGQVPVAIMIFSALTVLSIPLPRATTTVCGSMKRPVPATSATRLRDSWLRTTSISRPTTCWVRIPRSVTVMSSFTVCWPYISALTRAGQIETAPQGLRRNRAGVDADPPTMS